MFRVKYFGVDEDDMKTLLAEERKRFSAISADAAELFKDQVIGRYAQALNANGWVYPAGRRTGRLAKSIRARKYRVRVGDNLYGYRMEASVGHGIPYARVFELGEPEHITAINSSKLYFINQDGTPIMIKTVKTRPGANVFSKVVEEAWEEVNYTIDHKIEGYKRFRGF